MDANPVELGDQLHDALYRDRPLVGNTPLLDLTELQKLRRRIHSQVASSGDASHSLEAIFPRSMSYFQKVAPETNLVVQFMHSGHFERYIDLPFVGRGISREEAFFQFLRSLAPPDKLSILKHEFLMHMMKELAANPLPFFDIECEDIARRKKGYIAVVREGGKDPYLYASLEGRFIHGPITNLLSDLILTQTLVAALKTGPSAPVKTTIIELYHRGMLD